MTKLTVTEALADVKTTGKRIEKKREFVKGFLCRQDAIRDPLHKEGGSTQAIESERQSITDLEKRIVELRRGIQLANEHETITLNGVTRSIADWLIWRREVAPGHQQFLNNMRATINNVREQAKRQGVSMVSPGSAPAQPTDIVVNVDERALATEMENLEQTLGSLDGALSLKNATVFIRPVEVAINH